MKKIEEVARAIVERDEWDDYSPALQEACRKMAKRAIEAMREPSEEMRSALAIVGVCAGCTQTAWGAAIDAALNEGKE